MRTLAEADAPVVRSLTDGSRYFVHRPSAHVGCFRAVGPRDSYRVEAVLPNRATGYPERGRDR